MSSSSKNHARSPQRKYKNKKKSFSAQSFEQTKNNQHQKVITQQHNQHNQNSTINPFTKGGRLTLFGRKPVLEALSDPRITSQKLFLAHGIRGELIDELIRRAEQIGLPIERLSSIALSRISKHGKQDQGVALDVQAPLHVSLADYLQTTSLKRPLFLLDGLTTPANVGMVIRSIWASGAAGIILPREECAPLNPLAVKASAGVAIHAAVLSCQNAQEAVEILTKHQIPIFGLAGEAKRSLYEEVWPQSSVWVVGNESVGMSPLVRDHLTEAISLPMASGVESLNAATAASVVAFELSRQRAVHA